jgi:hypothetical protein
MSPAQNFWLNFVVRTEDILDLHVWNFKLFGGKFKNRDEYVIDIDTHYCLLFKAGTITACFHKVNNNNNNNKTNIYKQF